MCFGRYWGSICKLGVMCNVHNHSRKHTVHSDISLHLSQVTAICLLFTFSCMFYSTHIQSLCLFQLLTSLTVWPLSGLNWINARWYFGFVIVVTELNASGETWKANTDPSCCCALQVLEQWESQQGQSSPAQTSLSAPVIPHSAPFPTHHLHRASVPDSASEALVLAKPDPYDLYEKSRAIYESRRKYQCWCSRCSAVKTTLPSL